MKAKRNWQRVNVEKCQQSTFQDIPKSAWKIVFKLIEGFQGHHKSFIIKMFENAKGKTPKDSVENI
jgi:hypothetical protein